MFKFRLEPLIKVRKNELLERQAELAKAYEARRKLEEYLQEIERQLTEGTMTARNLMQPGQAVNVEHLLGLRRQEMFLRANQNQLTKDIQSIDEAIEQFRAAVIAANKEVKNLEKLKEREYARYTVEEKRLETKEMDEIAGNRQSRNR